MRDLLERAAYEDLLPTERAELDQLTVLDEEISLLKIRGRSYHHIYGVVGYAVHKFYTIAANDAVAKT